MTLVSAIGLLLGQVLLFATIVGDWRNPKYPAERTMVLRWRWLVGMGIFIFSGMEFEARLGYGWTAVAVCPLLLMILTDIMIRVRRRGASAQ